MCFSILTCRNYPTHRSSIKKIKFGPGKGNLKIMFLWSDGVDIWDCREVCLHEAVKYVFSFENYKGITAKLLRTRRGLMPYTLYSIKFSISQQYCWNTHLVPK